MWDVHGFGDQPSSGKMYGRYEVWIFSILASCAVGLSGVLPLIVIPVESSIRIKEGEGSRTLRLLLSFAVGGLLGDVFLHLLPEAWNHLEQAEESSHSAHLSLGAWVLSGMFTFIIVQMMFAASESLEKMKSPHQTVSINFTCEQQHHCEKNIHSNSYSANGLCKQGNSKIMHSNGIIKNGFTQFQGESPLQLQSFLTSTWKTPSTIHISGYLNLMANGIDNFTHGLAVAASFLVGTKMGIVTTFAILIHEIPHEVGDFAILLKSGFHPWDAAKAQLSTATIGVLGAIVALCAESVEAVGACTVWLLPFTAGGFLNIALVNVLPDLLQEEDPWESLKQVICICGGIAVMALVSGLTEL